MSNSKPSGGRFKSRRRGRRRPRQSRRAKSPTPKEKTASRNPAKPQIEELPLKKVFIYTYTIRKGG